MFIQIYLLNMQSYLFQPKVFCLYKLIRLDFLNATEKYGNISWKLSIWLQTMYLLIIYRGLPKPAWYFISIHCSAIERADLQDYAWL